MNNNVKYKQVKIENFKEEYIDIISKWIYTEWWKPIHDMSYDEVKKEYIEVLNDNKTIGVFVAYLKNKLIGHIFVKYRQYNNQSEFIPYITWFIIQNEYRRQWIWKLLMKYAINNLISEKWLKKIYLEDWSNIKWFYEKLWFIQYWEINYTINSKNYIYDKYVYEVS